MIRRFARPYAKAIMEVVQSPQKAGEIRAELAKFESVRAGSVELRDVYANPAIEPATKSAITKQIAQRLGLSELAVRVLDVLIQNHRINDLASIAEALAAMVRQATGTVAAEVRAAHPLSDQDRAQLQRTLQQKVGKNVELMVTTDPTLLGGFVAQIGSEIFDASVLGKINKFRQSLA